VQGRVLLDNNGAAVSGVTVILNEISTTPQATPANPLNGGTITITPIAVGATGISSGATSTATATTANDGSFSVSGLAAGQFAVCVRDAAAAVIDPCLWTDFQTTVAVNSGKLTSGLVVRVKKASTVSVQLNDSAQFLAPTATDTYPPHVMIGAFDARGGFHPAQQTAKQSSGMAYQLAIPVDSPVRLFIYSVKVQLATSSNVVLPAQGYSTTFVQPSSLAQTSSFTFNAVGRN
jgi:hypothetical protein